MFLNILIKQKYRRKLTLHDNSQVKFILVN